MKMMNAPATSAAAAAHMAIVFNTTMLWSFWRGSVTNFKRGTDGVACTFDVQLSSINHISMTNGLEGLHLLWVYLQQMMQAVMK